MTRFLVIGNSHINGIQRAAREVGAEHIILRSHEHMINRGGGVKDLAPDARKAFRGAAGPIFSVIGGNAHNKFALVYPETPFDFHHPDHPDRPPRHGVWMVPHEQVVDSIALCARTRLAELRAVATAFPDRVIHLESPPPIPGQRWLTVKLADRMAAAGIPAFEVAAPALRWKLWRINSAIFREECAKLGVPFAPVSAETCDENGFLLRQFWRDPTHANMHYGAIQLRQMTELMDVASV